MNKLKLIEIMMNGDRNRLKKVKYEQTETDDLNLDENLKYISI